MNVFTSGTSSKKNKGAYAFIMINDSGVKMYDFSQKIDENEINLTKERIELLAISKALEKIKNNTDEIIINCHCEFIVKTINEKWYLKWIDSNWNNIKNRDVWEKIIGSIKPNIKMKFTDISTTKNEWNLYIDSLAKKTLSD